jgi:hypothetical protein
MEECKPGSAGIPACLRSASEHAAWAANGDWTFFPEGGLTNQLTVDAKRYPGLKFSLHPIPNVDEQDQRPVCFPCREGILSAIAIQGARHDSRRTGNPEFVHPLWGNRRFAR